MRKMSFILFVGLLLLVFIDGDFSNAAEKPTFAKASETDQIEERASAPSGSSRGRIYVQTSDGIVRAYDGSAWKEVLYNGAAAQLQTVSVTGIIRAATWINNSGTDSGISFSTYVTTIKSGPSTNHVWHLDQNQINFAPNDPADLGCYINYTSTAVKDINFCDGSNNIVLQVDGSAGDIWVLNTCSAAAYIDRTDAPVGPAIDVIKNTTGIGGKLDHKTLGEAYVQTMKTLHYLDIKDKATGNLLKRVPNAAQEKISDATDKIKFLQENEIAGSVEIKEATEEVFEEGRDLSLFSSATAIVAAENRKMFEELRAEFEAYKKAHP